MKGDQVVVKRELPANGKKTKGRVRIKMEFIHNKLRRYTTFSKRKTGIMKKVNTHSRPLIWLPFSCPATIELPEKGSLSSLNVTKPLELATKRLFLSKVATFLLLVFVFQVNNKFSPTFVNCASRGRSFNSGDTSRTRILFAKLLALLTLFRREKW